VSIAVVLVASVADNGVIGRDNGLPWRLSSDLKHFKALTFGKPVVMGRKTFLSIGKPLPGRPNIVVTRDSDFRVEGVIAVDGVESAMVTARNEARRLGADEIMVIGGTDIFTQTMDLADRLEITHVHASPEGDTHFPAIDPKLWQETARNDIPAGPRDDAGMSFVTYRRIGT
jgi:dihydrofolate reductase